MVPSWKSWCRLCAREDQANTHINFHLGNEPEPDYLDAITKFFSIDIKLDDWPQTICPQCHQFVTNFINFIQRTSKVQAMFAELFSNLNEVIDPDQLKAQYELHELGDIELELKLFSNSPTEEAIIESRDSPEQMIDLEEIEYIDEEVLDQPHIKTEDYELDDDANNLYDDEWHNDDPQPDQDVASNKSLSVTQKSENDDEKEEIPPKVMKRGRPRIELETFSCSSCQKQFYSYSKFANHNQEEHGVSVDPLPYSCSKCSKAFSTQKAYQTHELTHLPPEEKHKISCPFCDKQFTKMNGVQSHIRTVHSGEKPFICEECGKGCKTFGALKEHKLTHTEETPFKCRYCDKSFKNKSRLKTHLDTHNETNYICTSCGLQLNTRRTLKMHMLVHSDQKRHKCDYCGNEFKRAKALKNHLILHTGLKPYTCNFCDKTFANGSNCRTHKKKTHPIELAAMEAAGTKVTNPNIPKLEKLRAVTSYKSVLIQDTTDTLVGLGQEFGSTVSIVSITDDTDSLRSDNQLSQLRTTTKEQQIILNNQRQKSEFVHNNMGYGQLPMS